MAGEGGSALPLCVDLDGTLLSTDTLYECLAVAIRDWRTLLKLPFWLLRGRARFKEELANCAALDVSVLPVNESVVRYVQRAREQGRPTVLVTAADRRIAELVSRNILHFDTIVASENGINLRGHAKAQRLKSMFGAGGFTYIGNDASDLLVWAQAKSGAVVNAPTRIARRAADLCEMVTLQDRTPSAAFAALVRALRPHQWSKNLLVFMPMFAAGAVADLGAWFYGLTAFAAFCAGASAIYVVNDILDLEADRRHPRKCRRPLASGELSLPAGGIAAAFLLVVSALLAGVAGIVWIVGLYVITSVLYSFWFKRRQLADVFILSSLYTIRLIAGGEATGYSVTMWLLAFSIFLFLGLALVKRVGELVALETSEQMAHGREYTTGDLPLLTMMGVASTFAATLVFALYIEDQAVSGSYAIPWLLWLNVPLILFWQCRIWLSTSRGFMHDDPIVYAAGDWVSRWVAASFLVIHVAAVLGPI